MTQLLEAPDEQRTGSRDPVLLHWVCVQIKDHPMIGLCGELTCGDRRKGVASKRDICAVCIDLAAAHCTGCPPCAKHLRKYR